MNPQRPGASPSLPPVQWVNCAQTPSWSPQPSAPIILHFWDSLCPASLHELGALRAIHRRYAPWGLRIYGVHRSAFSFTHEPTYLARAARRLGLRWPLALDENRARWPALPETAPLGTLLLDPGGRRREAVPPNYGDYTQFEIELRRVCRSLNAHIELPPPLKRDELTVEKLDDSRPVPLRPSDASISIAEPAATPSSASGRAPICELTGAWEPRADALVHLSELGTIRLRGVSPPVYAVLSAENSERSALIGLELETEDETSTNKDFFGTDVHKTGGGAALRVQAPRLYHVLKASVAPPMKLLLRTHDEGLAFYAWLFGPCVDPEPTSPS